jgi:hypothetical protein
LDHPDSTYGTVLLMQMLATSDLDFHAEILMQLGNASAHDGKVNERELNFMLAVVKGIQPTDQLETLLAAQMAVVHSLAMSMVCRLNGSFMLPQLEMTASALNKLTRTYAAQMEALSENTSGSMDSFPPSSFCRLLRKMRNSVSEVSRCWPPSRRGVAGVCTTNTRPQAAIRGR